MTLSDVRLVLALRCDEASELASAALDRELTAKERWALRFHTFVCKPCRRLVRQLRAMRELMSSAPLSLDASAAGASAQLSAERRRQIKQMLADAGQVD
jgi:anti-sigma factor RsiW